MRSQSSFRSINFPDRSNYFKPGITLIEILVTLGIFVILTAIGIPTISNYFRQSSGEQAQAILRDVFRDAQLRAMGSDGNQAWGVRIESNAVLLFPGTTFNQASAQSFALPQGVTCTATFVDTVFAQNQGTVTIPGTVTLTSTASTKSFILYASGLLSPQ